MIFHKPAGEANVDVPFLYGLHTIFNRTQGQVSGSMNVDPLYEKYTGQQS